MKNKLKNSLIFLTFLLIISYVSYLSMLYYYINLNPYKYILANLVFTFSTLYAIMFAVITENIKTRLLLIKRTK